jgi:hypothetical protein
MQSKYLGFCKRVGGIPDHLREVGHHELKHQHEAQALRENVQQPTGLGKNFVAILLADLKTLFQNIRRKGTS